MKQNLRVSVVSVLVAIGTRVGAVILAIATMAAIVFALLNFDQRARFESPDDGVSWRDTDRGVEAWHVAPNSPAQKAGIRTGDRLIEINGTAVIRSIQATKKLWRGRVVCPGGGNIMARCGAELK